MSRRDVSRRDVSRRDVSRRDMSRRDPRLLVRLQLNPAEPSRVRGCLVFDRGVCESRVHPAKIMAGGDESLGIN